jgi:Raf kinase inhibitor-like YbhB/YbcL family protein
LTQGRNDFGELGYGGPCPPEGETHTYVFRILALDTDLDLPPDADRAAFDAASNGHVIAEARLEAPYSRS